jgi:uncharacterized protein (TIGR04255 family)
VSLNSAPTGLASLHPPLSLRTLDRSAKGRLEPSQPRGSVLSQDRATEPGFLQTWLDSLMPNVRPGVRHYQRAPVVEAVVEIRCDLPQTDDPAFLKGVGDQKEFPSEETMWEVRGTVKFAPVGGETTTRALGYRFRDPASNNSVQAHLKGYAFSWRRQYTEWQEFTSNAEKHWLRYLDVAKPTRAKRLGVRFINRIVIPDESAFEDYVRLAVDIPPYLPQVVTEYLARVRIPIPELGVVAAIAVTFDSSDEKGRPAIILDIDVGMAVSIDLSDKAARDAIPDHLNVLRQAKNYVFESCITDATRSLIE